MLSVAALAGLALWAAWAVDVPEPGRRTGWRSWETASPAECGLLAQTLIATGGRGRNALPLMVENLPSAPCDWSRWGLATSRLSAWRFAASTRGDNPLIGYLPHLTLTAPRYSAFRLRAAVQVGHAFRGDTAIGEVCYFRRSWAGWLLQSCHTSWAS